MKTIDKLSFLEIVEEVMHAGGDTGWLARSDEQGYFVHFHQGTQHSEGGGLLGFEISCIARNVDLQAAAVAAALDFFKRAM